MNCRHCQSPLRLSMINLGTAPPSNAYLSEKDLHAPEVWYPLRVLVCETCWLVQTEDYAKANELFDAHYAYFSGYSSSWLGHCERYVDTVVRKLALDQSSLVVEVASNDGSLLQFVKQRGIPCLGVEPTHSTAQVSRDRGIDVVERFFGTELAHELIRNVGPADLVVANNVMAHVPDVNDFARGLYHLLKPRGVVTLEFPHLLNLIGGNQFDTIYHEHFSYLSFTAFNAIARTNGLRVTNVEHLETHGGSLRVYCSRAEAIDHQVAPSVDSLLQHEQESGITDPRFYIGVQSRAERAKDDLLSFLLTVRKEGRLVVGYGAAAKGNTLLNFAGVRSDLLPYVVDLNPAKQGKSLPGSRIPIAGEDRLRTDRPDYIVIFPWNIATEIRRQIQYVREWGCRFVVAIPELRID